MSDLLLDLDDYSLVESSSNVPAATANSSNETEMLLSPGEPMYWLRNYTQYTKEKKEKYPAKIYLFEVTNKNTRERYQIYSELTIKTHQNDVIEVIVVFLLLTLKIFYTFF